MSMRFKAAPPEDNWGRAKVARFNPARVREARKEPDDCRLPIANCRLKERAAFQLQLEIGNRKSAIAQGVRYVR
jgi:hypothetical protein